MSQNIEDRVSQNIEDTCSGAPRGSTIPELLADFPYLDRDDVLAALEFAAAAVQEREVPLAHSA